MKAECSCSYAYLRSAATEDEVYSANYVEYTAQKQGNQFTVCFRFIFLAHTNINIVVGMDKLS